MSACCTASDGVLEDISLASRSSRTLLTVLGVGLGSQVLGLDICVLDSITVHRLSNCLLALAMDGCTMTLPRLKPGFGGFHSNAIACVA